MIFHNNQIKIDRVVYIRSSLCVYISYFEEKQENFYRDGIMKNGKKLYNERGITFFHETERYVNNLNIYNPSKNDTNLWDDLI